MLFMLEGFAILRNADNLSCVNTRLAFVTEEFLTFFEPLSFWPHIYRIFAADVPKPINNNSDLLTLSDRVILHLIERIRRLC